MNYTLSNSFIEVLCNKISQDSTEIEIGSNPPFIKIKANLQSYSYSVFYIFEFNGLFAIHKPYVNPIGMDEYQTKMLKTAIANRIPRHNSSVIPKDFYNDFKEEMIDAEMQNQLEVPF